MPAYNYATWVAKAIDSVLAQDYPADRLELIVVDDGSTDGTPEVLAGFGDRIRTVRRVNGGLNAATTTGIEHATGELLSFIDADDLWPADRTRLLVDALVANPDAGIAFGDMEVIDTDDVTTHESFRDFLFISTRTDQAFGRLVAANFVSAGSMLIRASLRDHYHPIPDFAPYQDWWMAVKVAEVARIVSIDGVVNRYRRHDDNMNLGAERDRVLGMRLKELPFRRWLVSTVAAEGRTAEEQLAGLNAYDMILGEVRASQGQGSLAEVHPSSDEERERARELRDAAAGAAARGDDAGVVEALVRAAALEPGADRTPLDAAMARLRGDAGEGAPRCRSFAAFVKISDIETYPSIVARWSERFDGASDATLVIGGVTRSGHVNLLVDLVTRLGIHGEHGADLVTLSEPDAAGAAARLGRPMDMVLAPPPAAAHAA
jgi:glycosyltransferase involved in cell wall biosynthesis